MSCKLSLLAAVLAACVDQVVCANANFSLYAYGTGISGLQLFYGDGQAYVGASAPSFISEAVNITLSQNEDDTEFVASPNGTVDWDSQPTMYVDTTEGGINPVGFVTSNETLGDGASVTGFGLYGGWAFHKNDDSAIEMKFIATPTNETGIYIVKWNAGGTKSDDDVSIALRTMAPVVISS